MFTLKRFLLELLVVGVIIVIVGLPITYLGMKLGPKDKNFPTDIKTWFNISLSLFIIGCLVHIVFEVSGMNRQYVNYYCNK